MMPRMRATAPTPQQLKGQEVGRPKKWALGSGREIRWLLTALAGGLVLGGVAGLPLTLLPLLAVIGYALWLIKRSNDVVTWLEAGAETALTPASAGLSDAMITNVHREKRYSAKQKERYKRSFAQFNALAAELPDATIVINEQRQIRWANASALTLLGIHPERDRGQRIDNLLRDPAIQAFLSEPPGKGDIEVPAPRAPEKTLLLHLASPARNMYLFVARDITQRARSREIRKGFVADVSHELRTPLTVISGYLEVLLDDRTLPPSVQQALRQVGEQSDRMRELVEHLLELSRLENNPLGDDEGEPVVLGELIHPIRDGLAHDSPQHEFSIDADPLLTVTGSPSELYSVCQNLMTNAVHYTSPGTRIDVSWKPGPEGGATFEVRDNGPGIEPHHLPHLSERFYRVDRGRARASGGTGLGLAIVKHVAERHGGDLIIDSTPGTGSTFQVNFPASRIQRLSDTFPNASVG